MSTTTLAYLLWASFATAVALVESVIIFEDRMLKRKERRERERHANL